MALLSRLEGAGSPCDYISAVGCLLSRLAPVVTVSSEHFVPLQVSVRLASYDNPQPTRSLVLRIELDEQETVWCPVGDLFGTGVGRGTLGVT